MKTYTYLVIASLLLVVGSFPIVYRWNSRLSEHLARTLVTVGVAVAAATIAIFTFIERVNLDADSKRLSTYSLLRYFALEYAFVAYQTHSFRHYCILNKEEDIDGSLCKEGSQFAQKVGITVPANQPVFSAVNEISNTFPRATHISTLLIDAEIASRSRLAVVIDRFLEQVSQSGRNANQLRIKRIKDGLFTIEETEEAAAILYCILASTLRESTTKMDKEIDKIENFPEGLDAYTVKEQAAGYNMGSFECSNPREQIERLLPASGGGNGGGGGG